MYNVWTTRIREEKNFKIKFQVILVFYRTKMIVSHFSLIYWCPMKSHHSSDVHICVLSKAVQNCVTYNYYLGQMRRFRTKIIIPVTPLTHDVTSASKLRSSHFWLIQKKNSKSRLNIFCLPVDPLSFRHNFDSCDATANDTQTRTMSLCKLKYGVVWQNLT